MNIYKVRCPRHGTIQLSPSEYDAQMNRPNKGWMCPTCHGPAAFVGEFYRCYVCDALLNFEDSLCPECGYDHEAAWLGQTGGAR